jgi:hypothetical protein
MEAQATATAPDAQLDPEPIMRIASGFMASRHLFVANELGLFAALAARPLELEALSQATAIPTPTARIAADAMVALGLLERDEQGRYVNTPVAAHFLAGRTPADLRPFLRFWDRLSWPAWSGLEEAIRNGGAEPLSLDAQDNEVFAAGVEAITAGAAHALAAVPELSSRQRLLDLAGGTGSFLVPALGMHPQLSATLWELPETAEIARQRLDEAGIADRVEVIAGDALADQVPVGHDVIVIANFVHLLPPAANQTLLRRLRYTSAQDTVLLLVDFWTNDAHTEPLIAALLAGEFLLVGGQGDIYSVSEASQWLADAGWTACEHRPLAGPQTLIIAHAA